MYQAALAVASGGLIKQDIGQKSTKQSPSPEKKMVPNIFVGMCRKPKFGSDSVFKTPNRPKI